MSLENKIIEMEAFPIKGENGNYIYFPYEKDTVVKADRFSTDYLGFNADTKKKVICRHINPELLKINLKKLNLFIEASKLLNHDNLVKIYDAIIDNSNIMIVEEYLDSFSLKDLIYSRQLKSGKFDTFFILIIVQTLIALEYLHNNEICHCNINPDNILVMKHYQGKPNFNDPQIKICGLELIKLKNSSMPTSWENIKSFELFYASPEQVLNLEELVGAQSDIYNTGIVLYETIVKKHFMQEIKNKFYIQRMQYSSVLKNYDNIEENMFKIISKACSKKEFHKSFRYYSKEEIIDIVNSGIENRFKTAKEFGLTILKYFDYDKFEI